MAKTTFAGRQVFTAAHANALNNPQFVVDEGGEEFDGQHLRLRDASLSNDATQIKGRVNTFFDMFRVTAGTGLSVNVVGGVYTLDTGIAATIASTTLSLPASSTSYVFINSTGAIATSTIIPVRWVPLAIVTTSAAAVTLVVDQRERFKLSPIARAIPTFGGNGAEGDLTISSNTTLSGVRYVRNFTVNAGVTLTVTGFAHIKASGTVNIQGAIVTQPLLSGGRRTAASLPASAVILGDSGFGSGSASGPNTSPASAYFYTPFTPYNASGGSSSFLRIGSAGGADVTSAGGGLAGGGLFIEAAGAVSISGTITADGGNATAVGSMNAFNSTEISCTGATGGTGGVIWIASLTSIVATAAATFNARGGNSSAPFRVNGAAAINGCGGSSGGYCVFLSPATSINAGATLSVAGGQGGTGITGTGSVGAIAGSSFAGVGGVQGTSGGSGTNGGAGQIIQQNILPI